MAQDAKSIAQQIYDSKSWSGDNEEQLIAAIKKIPNAAAWQATDKQLQILSGEKGIFSYIRSFVRDNDTETWRPILTHIAKKRLVSNNMLKLYIQYLGGPSQYPKIISDEDNKKVWDDTIKELNDEDTKNDNSFGGDTAISWGLGILAAMGILGKIFSLAGVTGGIWLVGRGIKNWKSKRAARAAGAAVKEIDMTRPGMLKRQFLKLEQFITRGILGNTGSLRRMINRLESQRLITATQARTALKFIEDNRYAIASEIRKIHMNAVIDQFMKTGNKSDEAIRNVLSAIPTTGPDGDAMRNRFNTILRRAADQEERTLRARERRPQSPQPAEPYRRRTIGF